MSPLTHPARALPLHRVRPYRPETDEGYLVVSWTAELVRSPTLAGIRDRDLACGLVRPHVRALIDRHVDRIAVVVPTDREEPIEAFCVADGPVLYGLHVKAAFRGQGIMTDLLTMHGFPRGSRVICATDTRDLRGIMERGLYDVALRPDLLLMGA